MKYLIILFICTLIILNTSAQSTNGLQSGVLIEEGTNTRLPDISIRNKRSLDIIKSNDFGF